jgi:eukaryotic-like serine/threonine-protein kinase
MFEPPSRTSEPPARLFAARYALEASLGRGGAGEVFRAFDLARGELIALKQLHESARARAGLERLFEREFRTLAQLAHPGIVAVHDYGVAEGSPYYTMELLDGADLRDLAPLPWREACSVLCEVASALALLHSRRLVHRDLSPRNVRRTASGQPKLIDFGAMVPMGHTRKLMGTPGCVAPEHVRGQELDARSDMFGLGTLLYWTLTGRPASGPGTSRSWQMRGGHRWRCRPRSSRAFQPISTRSCWRC